MTTGLKRTIALQTLLLALFMDLLDNGIVNIAIPTIVLHFKATPSEIQWIVSAYTLAFSLMLLLTARLGDYWGRKRMFVTGVIGFAVFSALCGLAPTPRFLILARTLEGVAAAFMVPQVLSSIQVMFAPEERGGAIAAFSMLAGLANTAAPFLGAWLTKADVLGLSWRAIFWVNVPVGLLTMVAAVIFLPESKSEEGTARRSLDWPGVLLSTFATLLLVYPLIVGRAAGWPAWTWGSFAASLVVWVLFFLFERHKERTFRDPLIPASIFRVRSFFSGIVLTLVYMLGIIGFFFAMVLYLHVGLGFTLVHSALAMLPWSLGVPIGAGVAANALIPRHGRKIVQVGIMLTLVGLALLIAVVAVGRVARQTWPLLPGIFIGGLGMGFAVAGFATFTVNEIPEKRASAASGVYNMVAQFAAALGIAILGTIFFSGTAAAGAPATYVSAFRTTLWAVLGFVAVGFVASFGLPKRLAKVKQPVG
jgi:EmrB/QacA subfamily drug resistance transporter